MLLQSISDVNMEIESRRMRGVGYVALTGENRNSYVSLVGKPKRRGDFEDLGVDERIILKWIF
jgi:hypothetical protein